MAESKRGNILSDWLEQQRAEHGHTYGYWAERWGVKHSATIARWASGVRRMSTRNAVKVFADLPFTMEQYYSEIPPSDQTQQRSDVRYLGRTRARRKQKEINKRERRKRKNAWVFSPAKKRCKP